MAVSIWLAKWWTVTKFLNLELSNLTIDISLRQIQCIGICIIIASIVKPYKFIVFHTMLRQQFHRWFYKECFPLIQYTVFFHLFIYGLSDNKIWEFQFKFASLCETNLEQQNMLCNCVNMIGWIGNSDRWWIETRSDECWQGISEFWTICKLKRTLTYW